jgi:DNA primase
LPEGEDPDSLVRAGDGKKSFGKTISDAQPLAKFLFDAGSDGLRLDTPERRARLEAELLRHCETIQNGIVRKEYQRTFQDMLWQLHHKKRQSRLKQTRREAIREYRFQRDLVRGPQAEQPFGRKLMETASRRLVRRRQEIVLATLINHPALISDYDEALDEIVFDPDLDKLRAELQNQLLSGDMLDPEALKHHLFSRGVESIYSAVTSQGVYSLAPQAKPTADIHAARSLLDHILLIRQQASLEREYLAEGVRIDDGNTEGETGKLKNDAGSKKPARVKRLEELRRLMEDVEGRLGPDISEYGDS